MPFREASSAGSKASAPAAVRECGSVNPGCAGGSAGQQLPPEPPNNWTEKLLRYEGSPSDPGPVEAVWRPDLQPLTNAGRPRDPPPLQRGGAGATSLNRRHRRRSTAD